MSPDNRNPRIVVNPTEDPLLEAGSRYLDMVANNASDAEKGHQYSVFEMLLDSQLKQGIDFPFPDQEDLPSEQLYYSDTLTEDQTVALVGVIVKELRARQRSRYSYG